ncbi:sensor histidine kinase [Pseudomarimonas arenosa]|uniref:histidine kinase n=1 Tax=Pseudomarimonas arenosa TaxID=2774145 RepID=A0AAW3ZQN3_9GAMM|nr:hybrid sensor histidine kinase/response regulator [Pseudomarimonas arenosa]MBD8527794.1 response regulator [Pseudomarimonas arenosa]
MDEDRAKPLVLLVDDDPLQLEWLDEVLRDDFATLRAECGQQALALVQQGIRPDLLLLDVKLPDLSGHEVLRCVHAIPGVEHLPVIMISADRSEQNEMAGFDLGADDFVAKPIDPRILMLRMRNLLQRESLRQETLRLGLAQAEQALNATQMELRATRLELEEAAKLQALGRMVASFAHDIGNPIGNSLLAITTLQDELSALAGKLEDNQLSRSALQRFVEVSRDGANLAVKNLDLARLMLQSFKQQAMDQATAQCREVELGAWLREVVFVLSPMWRRREIDVQVEVADDLRIITLPGPLGQIVGNLIGNAVAHAFEPGQPGTVRLIASAVGDDQVELRVIDNGKGMSPEVAAKAMEPFFTTRAGKGGTGLGLDIVKQATERQLQGCVSFSSHPGVGTDFCLRLPRRLPDPVAEKSGPASAS